MFARNLGRAISRPAAAGLVRKVVGASAALPGVPLRCASNLSEVLRREVAEERPLSDMDEGEWLLQ